MKHSKETRGFSSDSFGPSHSSLSLLSSSLSTTSTSSSSIFLPLSGPCTILTRPGDGPVLLADGLRPTLARIPGDCDLRPELSPTSSFRVPPEPGYRLRGGEGSGLLLAGDLP
ncbi:hypothetical protein BVRB_8g184160 [Beta vulgaris subsp. vulgaris]|nr:hypothetical protein BVRB_8g184160 [Beta vulgaris subsp. vulgaris]